MRRPSATTSRELPVLGPAAAVARLALPVADRGLQRVHRMYLAYLLVMVVGGLFLVLASHRPPALQLTAVVGLALLALLGVAGVSGRSLPGADAACAVALGTTTLAVDAPSTALGLLFAVVCVRATAATPGRRGWAWLAAHSCAVLAAAVTVRWGLHDPAADLVQIASAMPGAIVTAAGTRWLARTSRARARAERELVQRVSVDELTGLGSRVLLSEVVAAQCEAGPTAAALVVVDLDGFGQLNAALGREAGNELLVAAGARLAGAAGPDDLVVRLGGDEFAVLLADEDGGRDVAAAADRLLAAVVEPLSLAATGTVLAPRASGGLVAAAAGRSAEDLLRDADGAVRAVKAAGGGSIGRYRPELRVQLQERLALAEDLRRAVAADALEVHFQPCYDAAGRITTTEALVRWHHEVHGYVPPDRFIPLAEATDLIHDLGRQVLRTACAQTRRWQDQLGRRLSVNVNVSGRQLGDPRLVDDVAQALAASGLVPGDLTVEVTETALLDDPQRARTALLALRELGVRIALDDFGTGFSSLERLRTMPVDCLKIDQQFVRDLDAPAGRALVSSVIDLAHALGLGTVAEGVEEPEQRDWLVAHGCDVLQGYLLARPVPAASVTPLLAGRPVTARVD